MFFRVFFPVFLLGAVPGTAFADDPDPLTVINRTYKPGQFEISSLIETTPAEKLAVEVRRDGKPLSGITVYFDLIRKPSKSEGTALGANTVVTGEDGIAATPITLGNKTGIYRVTAFVPDAEGSPVIFTVTAHKRFWLVFLLISLLGGLAVFLFGMTYMSDSLQNLGGHRFIYIIERATSNRFKALAVGTLVTAIIQSSSATTVMVVGLINSGLMQFAQSIGIILGANIGTTITAQIVAFKLTDYALWFVLAGFLISCTGASKKRRLLGQTVLGFGLLFFGMKLMGDVTKPLRTYQPFIDFLLNLQNPIIGVIVGAVFTTLIQSSSAATGVYIALSFQGLMTLEAAIPLIFGANIGTCTTALLASIGASRDAKRAALAHIIFNGIKVCAFLPFIPWYRDLIYQISPHPTGTTELVTMEQISTFAPRMIANAHSIAKIIAVTVALPFTGRLARLCELILPRTEKEKTIKPKYLSKDLLKYPEMALAATKNEVVRMGGYTIGMLDGVINVMKSRKPESLERIVLEDENIDILYKEIRPYLARITQEVLDREESLRETEIIITAEELENIGDVISKSLISTLTKCVEYDLWFSDRDWAHIVDFHGKIRADLINVREAFRNDNLELAREIAASREAISIYYKALHIAHLKKHRSGVAQTIEMSSRYLNMIADFRQIHTLITNIAQAVVDFMTEAQEGE